MLRLRRRRARAPEPGGHRLLNLLGVLLVIFLVLFPKGGIKPAGLPITWGYLLIGLTIVPALVYRTIVFPLLFRPSALLAYATTVPLQLLMLYSLRANGYAGGLGIVFSDLTVFFLFPFLFLLVYPVFLPWLQAERFRWWFCFSVLTAALWGIFLFVWHPIFGSYLEIPLLTVNLGDYGMLEATKHIDRGAFYKLISTYNNGNVYGVATLILLPLYRLMEPSRWKRNTVRFALVLTLSRTVWLGLIVEQLMSAVASLPEMLGSLPRIYPGVARRRLGALVLTFVIVLAGSLFTMRSLAFLTDSSLGGRETQFLAFVNPTMIPEVKVSGFAEVMYTSALSLFGVTGFLSIVLLFLSPLLLIAFRPGLIRAPVHRAAAKGLLLYAVIAGADGSTNLIPVMAFYWFMYMTFLHGLPGEPALGEAELAAPPLLPQGAAQPGTGAVCG